MILGMVLYVEIFNYKIWVKELPTKDIILEVSWALQ
jgi:hypothetical protein